MLPPYVRSRTSVATVEGAAVRVRARSVVLAAAALLLLLPLPAVAQRRVALVVGAASYSAVDRLNNATRDAQLIASALARTGFADVVTVENPTRDRFMSALRDFAERADGADVAFVYYAGHGLEMDGANWLIPVDARLRSDRDLDFEAVRLESVLGALKGARTRVVALDACRDNPFLPRMRRISSTRAISRGLGRLEVDDVLLMYAAEAGATAADGTGEHSPFARALDRWLPEPGLDLRLMAGSIRDQVLQETNGLQRPYVSASLSGNVVTLSPPRRQAWTGAWVEEVDDYWRQRLSPAPRQGVIIGAVYQRTPASTAGLLEGDVIVRFGNREVTDYASFSAGVDAMAPGERVVLRVLRAGTPLDVSLVMESRPSWEELDEIQLRGREMSRASNELAAVILQDVNLPLADSAKWTSATTVSSRLLPFYFGIRLVELVEATRKRTRRARLLYRHPEVTMLDFTNVPIYATNRRDLPPLKQENVADYVKFYFDNVSGRYGRFIVAEKPADVLWRSQPSADTLRLVHANLLPIRPEDFTALPQGGYRFKVSLIFKAALFHSFVEVLSNGTITLDSEQLIAMKLPLLIEAW